MGTNDGSPIVPPSENANVEEWRWWFRMRLQSLDADIQRIRRMVEEMAAQQEATLMEWQKRLAPLEQLRSMVIGAGVVMIAMAPFLWWLVTKVATMVDKSGGIGVKP